MIWEREQISLLQGREAANRVGRWARAVAQLLIVWFFREKYPGDRGNRIVTRSKWRPRCKGWSEGEVHAYSLKMKLDLFECFIKSGLGCIYRTGISRKKWEDQEKKKITHTSSLQVFYFTSLNKHSLSFSLPLFLSCLDRGFRLLRLTSNWQCCAPPSLRRAWIIGMSHTTLNFSLFSLRDVFPMLF